VEIKKKDENSDEDDDEKDNKRERRSRRKKKDEESEEEEEEEKGGRRGGRRDRRKKDDDDEEKDRRRGGMFEEERVRVLHLAEKLRLLFDATFPEVHSLTTNAVWAAGEVLEFAGNFEKYITSRGLQKQEGIIFRHLLRLILLVKELRPLTPPDTTPDAWRADLDDIATVLSNCCRVIDPTSTDKALDEAEGKASDV